MFALAFSAEGDGEDRVRLYRFTSTDAMNWIKGDDGKPERITFDLVDAKTGRKVTNHDVFSCFYDGRDAAHPYKGWLHFANWGDLEGIYFVRSKDGKIWERGQKRSIEPAYYGKKIKPLTFDDAMSCSGTLSLVQTHKGKQ